MNKKKVIYLLLLFLIIGCKDRVKTPPVGDSVTPNNSSEKASILFLSTQLNPIEEADRMRSNILEDFTLKVDFQPNDNNYIFKKMIYEVSNNLDQSIIFGGLHGDLLSLYSGESLRPLNGLSSELSRRDFIPNLLSLGHIRTDSIYYYPWMQATYLMMANKKSLKYLPDGVDINNITYSEFTQWGKNMMDASGSPKIGFPVGDKGLMHRFLQGYLYPSYTGNTLLKFKSPLAIAMWEEFRNLWKYVNPGSLVYSNMSQPLITEDVWVVWDHTARLITALEDNPKDYIVFPSPVGPKGRGYISVLSGLAIPKGSKNIVDSIKLIEYLTSPEVQIKTLEETGFFPTININNDNILSAALVQMNEAVSLQSASEESITTLLPIGLGEKGKDFNSIFLLTFFKTVINSADIRNTLDVMGERLQEILNSQNIRAWEPDICDDIPCILE